MKRLDNWACIFDYAKNIMRIRRLSICLLKNNKGGSGVWGDAIMTPHPEIVTDDAMVMVEYILGLDDQLSKPFDKFSLGIKSMPVKLPRKFDQKNGNGFLAQLYINNLKNHLSSD